MKPSFRTYWAAQHRHRGDHSSQHPRLLHQTRARDLAHEVQDSDGATYWLARSKTMTVTMTMAITRYDYHTVKRRR